MKVLLIIDMQNDFCAGGALAVPGGDEIIPGINALMSSGQFDLIVASKDWHPKTHLSFSSNQPGTTPFQTIDLDGIQQILWPDHCVEGSPGADFHPDLRIDLIEKVVLKGTDYRVDSAGAFFDNQQRGKTDLHDYLLEQAKSRGIEPSEIKISICGLATDYCVAYSARDSIGLGFETELIVDACRGLSVESELKALRELAQIGVQIKISKEILPEIRRSIEIPV